MLMCVVLSCLFLVALWSPAGKGLTSWLSCLLYFVTSKMCPFYIFFFIFPDTMTSILHTCEKLFICRSYMVHIRIKGEVGAMKVV